MDIKFSGVLQLINGSKVKTFPIPGDGVILGMTGITENDFDRVIKIAAGTTDQLISLGGVDAGNFIIIVSDQDISFKKNSSGGEANPIVAKQILSTDKKQGMYLHTTSGLTSLYFSNSGSESANVEIYVAS